MDTPLVSVIVPIYNVEKYLRTCVDSILAQSYSVLEIILVDDGSTDGGPQICDQYAQQDPRVRVIHQKNAGLSAARNAGIDICRGEYLTFVDSDDFIHGRFVELLLNACLSNNAYISVGDFEQIPEDSVFATYANVPSQCTTRCVTGRDANFMIYDMSSWVRIITAWGKLFHRTLFMQARFPIVPLHEDEALLYKLFYRTKFVALCDCALYFYRSSPNSLMGQSFSEKRLAFFPILEARAEFYLAHSEEELYKQTILRAFYIATQYCSTVLQKEPQSLLLPQLHSWQKKAYHRILQTKPGFLHVLNYMLMLRAPKFYTCHVRKLISSISAARVR